MMSSRQSDGGGRQRVSYSGWLPELKGVLDNFAGLLIMTTMPREAVVTTLCLLVRLPTSPRFNSSLKQININ
jgi:hypothetical protein